MNVALVHRRYTEHGGTERFLVGLARYLREQGHMVHVYCNEVRDDLRDEPGVAFHHLPMVKLGQVAKVVSLWWSSIRAARGGHDVVVALGRTRGHALYRAGGGAHAAYLEACRPMWWLGPLNWIERWIDRSTVRSARRVLSPSGAAASDLARCYDVDRERIAVVHNGVDSARFRPDPARRAELRAELGVDGPLLAFVGTGFERKGLAEAIEVARTLELPIFVVGRDRHLERWRRRYPEVRFLGPQAEPQRFLVAADVMLLPTRYEPYGNVCLEAMACGVVPVTTPWNGVSEVFPLPGLTGATLDELVAATRLALEGGDDLKRRCREAAEGLPREAAYAGLEALLVELA